MRIISSIYKRQPRKLTVNARRINREMLRHKLALAGFVDIPRLVKAKFDNHPRLVIQP